MPDSAADEIRLATIDAGTVGCGSGGQRLCSRRAQGQYGSFLFIDPMANLLGWSEDLSSRTGNWACSQPRLASAIPWERTRASSTDEPDAPERSRLQQTRRIPGDYIACFSAWVRSDVAGNNYHCARFAHSTLPRSVRMWKRVYVSGTGTTRRGCIDLLIVVLAAGQTVNVWGLQVEAQPYPSQYKQTARAREFTKKHISAATNWKITSTAPGLSSCEVFSFREFDRRQYLRSKMQSVLTAKEQLNADTPVFLFDCTLSDGTVQHWSSRTLTWNGIAYRAAAVAA